MGAGTWPLVGRRCERAAIADAISRGQRGGVVVAGEAGVGKTRLALAAVEDAERAGLATAWVTATREAAAIPLAAFAPLLPGSAGQASLLALLRDTATALRAAGGPRRLVLSVDDAHLLDDASAALLHHLATTAAAFVIVTVRSEEPCPDAVTALWKDGGAEWLEIGPLSRDETAELVRAALGEPVDGVALAGLWRLSQGNALFLRELVDGALSRVAGRWRLTGPPATTRLKVLVEARLARLDPQVRAAAEAVTFAEGLGEPLLRAVTDLDALGEAERAGLVRVDADERRTTVRPAHPLYGEVLRDTTPALRALQLRQGLGEALEATGLRRRGDALRLALWRLEAEGTAKPGLLLAAAHQARAGFDHGLAARLAVAAHEGGGGFWALSAAAEARLWQGEAGEADRLFDEAERAAPDAATRSLVLAGRAGNLFLGRGEAEQAERILRRADDLGAGTGELAALRAVIALSRGHVNDALACLGGVPDVADAQAADLHAVMAAVGARALHGEGVDALRLADGALVRAREVGADEHLVRGLDVVRYAALACAGRQAEAVALTADRHRRAVESEGAEQQAVWSYLRGQAALMSGVLPDALPLLAEGAALLDGVTTFLGPAGLPSCLANLAEAHALTGDAEAATTALEAAEASWRGRLYEVDLARGWVAAARGEMSAARRIAAGNAQRAGRLGAHALQARALHDVARLGAATDVEARLTELAPAAGPIEARYAAHASALAAGDGALLDRSADDFEAGDQLLLAAEAAAEACAAHRAAGRNARR